jgi:hypothetical protein
MDLQEYTFEVVMRDRLAELRAEAALWHQPQVARPAPPPLRHTVGRALVRMGARLLAVRRAWLSEVRP